MAAPLTRAITASLSKHFIFNNTQVLGTTSPLVQQCCGKKTKARGAVRKLTRTNKKYRKTFREEGDFVYKGELLVRQLGLDKYPGENVGIQRNNSLYALTEGKVYFTAENLNPYPDSPLYEKVQNGIEIKKQFINIYPTKVHAKFRLVSQS